MAKEEYEMRYTCSQCGHSYSTTLYQSVDANERPDLKRKLLEGSLYETTCPHCGSVSFLLYSCLYMDSRRSFMIHLAQDEAGRHVFDDMPLSRFTLRIVQDWNDMREKVVLFDRGIDDRAVEIMKCIRIEQLRKKNPALTIESIYYQPQDGGKFIVLSPDTALATIRFDRGLYHAVQKQVLPQIDSTLASSRMIDADWAKRAFVPALSMLVTEAE